jgi:hypothetical protein
LRWRL